MTEQRGGLWHERKIQKELEAKGYKVLHRGWPDFLVVDRKSFRITFIEAKYSKIKRVRLSFDQKQMHAELVRLGISVYVCCNNVDFNLVEEYSVNPAHTGRVYKNELQQLRNKLQQLRDEIKSKDAQLRGLKTQRKTFYLYNIKTKMFSEGYKGGNKPLWIDKQTKALICSKNEAIKLKRRLVNQGQQVKILDFMKK